MGMFVQEERNVLGGAGKSIRIAAIAGSRECRVRASPVPALRGGVDFALGGAGAPRSILAYSWSVR